MAKKTGYRPQAPSDGFGNITVDSPVSDDEATAYAHQFIEEENTRCFHIGVSNFRTNRAFVYAIEAARLLCGGSRSEPFALRLLEMAIDEVRTETRPKAA
jgi:hypothetical protein